MKSKHKWATLAQEECPEVVDILNEAKNVITFNRIRMRDYQAAHLYRLASQFNGAPVLEIGTGYGYSTYFLACACAFSKIITLNPDRDQLRLAREALREFPNIMLLATSGRQYLHAYNGDDFGFILVSGDHGHVERDFSWFDHLMLNGMILFHRARDPVHKLNRFGRQLGRPPDVRIIDKERCGMIGWYRRAHESYGGLS